jgi:hypothetical protein
MKKREERIFIPFWKKIKRRKEDKFRWSKNRQFQVTADSSGGFSPPALTTPCMWVRTGSFTKVTGP